MLFSLLRQAFSMVTVLRQMMVLFVLQVQQGHTLKLTLCVLRKQIQ